MREMNKALEKEALKDQEGCITVETEFALTAGKPPNGRQAYGENPRKLNVYVKNWKMNLSTRKARGHGDFRYLHCY